MTKRVLQLGRSGTVSPRLRHIGTVCALVVVALLVIAGFAQAATIHVTTTSDESSSNDGSVSLREAIQAINAGSSLGDPDISGQNPGTYGSNDTVVIPASATHYGLTVEIPVMRSLTIQGAGAGSSVIDAQSNGRAFHVTPGVGPGGTVTFQGVTITGGHVTGEGGGVLSDGSSGSLVLTNVAVSVNTVTSSGNGAGAHGGGGVFTNGSSITLTNSTVSGNTVTASSNGAGANGGGGVYNNGGDVTLTNSTVSGNAVTANSNGAGANGGGGVYNNGSNITLTNSTVSGNTVTANNNTSGANGGGGVYNNGSNITLTNSTVSGNTVTANNNTSGANGGGGFYNNGGDITLTNSTVSDNTASVSDTNSVDGGGGFFNNGGIIMLTGSTISDNAANLTSTDISGGGGLYDNGGGGAYVNGTLSGNSTNVPTGAGTTGGGAVFMDSGTTTTLTNVTIAGNSAVAASGGGVFSHASTTAAKSSIVAQNTAGSGSADCGGTSTPTYTSLGHNLESGTDCGFTASGDQRSANPQLGPLNDNGGPTMTRALQNGSPAIDAIPQAACADQSSPTPQPVTSDQRGFTRPDDGETGCDIGAYESQEPASVATVVNDAATNAPWSGTEGAGASAYDTATVGAKNGVKPSGTLTYSLFSNGSCSGTPMSTQQVTLGANGSVPNSSTAGPFAAASYSYVGAYSGDGNYQGAAGSCEAFTVGGPPVNTARPTISGTVRERHKLTEIHGTWTNNPTSLSYQWERCDHVGNKCQSIGGATGQSYTPVARDVGHTIRVQETARNASGSGGPVASAPTATVVFAARASIVRLAVAGTLVKVLLRCRGDAGASCSVKLRLTVTEKLKGGKVIAVTATRSKKPRRRLVLVGQAATTIAVPMTKTVKITLNAAGSRLLAKYHTLRVDLTASQSGQTISSKTVRFETRRK